MKKIKNILLIGPIPPPVGGVSIHLSRILERSIAETDLSLQVLDIRRLRLHATAGSSGNVFKIIRAFFGSDIIHLHISKKVKVILVNVSKFFGKKVLYTHHNSRNLSDPVTLRTIDKVHQVILVRDFLSDLPPKYHSKCSIISAYIPSISKVELPQELTNQFSNAKVLFSYCFQNKDKPVLIDGEDLYGFDIILEAVQNIGRDLPDTNFVLFLVDPRGAMQKHYDAKLRAVRKASNLKIIYWTTDLDFISVLGHCDVLIRATRSDGDSISVREALHSGVPVLASDCEARPEGTKLFLSGNYHDLAIKLLYMLEFPDRQMHIQQDFAPEIFKLYRSM